MKANIKVLALLALIFSLSNNADAQYNKQPVNAPSDFRDAFGIRFGVTTGVTYKHRFSSYHAIELILGTYPHAMGMTALYERYILTNVDGLNLYLGGGAHVAQRYSSTWRYSYNSDNDMYYNHSGSYNYGPIVGIDAIGGAEYKFRNTPVALSFDFKPYAEFYRGRGPYCRLDPGLGIKFTF